MKTYIDTNELIKQRDDAISEAITLKRALKLACEYCAKNGLPDWDRKHATNTYREQFMLDAEKEINQAQEGK